MDDRDPVGPPRTPVLEYIRPAKPDQNADHVLQEFRFLPNPDDVAVSRKLIQWCRRQKAQEA